MRTYLMPRKSFKKERERVCIEGSHKHTRLSRDENKRGVGPKRVLKVCNNSFPGNRQDRRLIDLE